MVKPNMECAGMSVRSTIVSVFERVAREQHRTQVPLTDDLEILGSALDSLSFAIIVVRLEDELGFDPFNSDGVEFPITFGDFVHLYEARQG
jgi:acyl carrier protein